MTDLNIYRDISSRTNGAIMIGVVGPVRTGKSTFIKKFMETLVIPHIDDVYMRERAKDELPQSGSGRTIMTAEPKFVPEEAVNISLSEEIQFSVRLADCVGYMVEGAAGQFENGEERLVTTPWFDHEVSMTEAAESGTHKVISEHSTIGLVITTDGSICDINREAYVQAEERVIKELKDIGKPFIILLNCQDPNDEYAVLLEDELRNKYDAPCKRVSCQQLNEQQINEIMSAVLGEFPVSDIAMWLPEWFDQIEYTCELKKDMFARILEAAQEVNCIREIHAMLQQLAEYENVEKAELGTSNLGSGTVNINIEIPKKLYYEMISNETELDIRNDGDLMNILREMSVIKKDYDKIKEALYNVRNHGYGVVMPDADSLELDEPKIVKQGGKYAVSLKAKAPAIHMLKTSVETTVSPNIGGENASDEIISFLIQGFDGDMNRLWESNIFGRPLYDIAEEGISEKLNALPENARAKLQETLQRVINEGRGTVFCILL